MRDRVDVTGMARRLLRAADQDLFDESNGRSRETLFASWYGDLYESRCLLQTDHCAVLVDVSPIVAGHLLIVPRKRSPNLARMRNVERRDIARVVDRAQTVLADAFGPPTAFEHGAAGFGAPGPCVDYAHLHLAPIGEVDFVQRAEALRLHPLPTSETLPDAACSDGEYFFWNTPGDPTSFFARVGPGQVVPRQFFRSAVGEELGIDQWDWALGGGTYFDETIERLRGAF